MLAAMRPRPAPSRFCASALERLRLAEMRAEAAERAQRELIITAEHKLQGACRAVC